MKANDEGFLRFESDGVVGTMSPYVTLSDEAKEDFRQIAANLRKIGKWYNKASKQNSISPADWGLKANYLQEIGEVQGELCGMMNLMEYEKYQERQNVRN